MDYKLVCTKCGHVENDAHFRCGKCDSILEVRYNYVDCRFSDLLKKGERGLARYVELLPVEKLETMGEGHTPLKTVKVDGIPTEVHLKLEIGNPTKTFKDRGSVVELSKASELDAKAVCCASTGNMGLSVAHYARHLGMNARIFISRKGNREKIRKIRLRGAKIDYVEGDFNEALGSAEEFANRTNTFLCGDYHFRKEGQKTIIYEIAEQTNYDMPDYIFVPVGNGTLFAGMYKGLTELQRYGAIKKTPKMMAVQSRMCDPLVRAFNGNGKIRYVKPGTEADAIAVGYPTFGFESLNAIRHTKGSAIAVSESEIKDAVRLLEKYGVYAELGGGTAFAGFLKMYGSSRGKLKGKKILVVITGNNEGRFA